MLRTLLIADLHLDASRADTVQAALNTFTAARHLDALWILGDLFEAWIGDDAGLADPLGRRIADALSALTASGTEVHLMRGNRDFLLGEAFAQAAGATLHPEDECHVRLAGLPVLLMHGDTLCTADQDYGTLRRQLRDPAWQAGFLALSIEQRLAAARRLRDASRDAGSRKAQDIMDVTPATVHERLHASLREHGVVDLIHGHTHRPATHAITLSTDAPASDVPASRGVATGDVPGSNTDSQADRRTDRRTTPQADTSSSIAARRLVLGDWHADGGEAILADADGLRRVRCPAGIQPPCPG